ncbi:MAG TPA: hypothetical protein VM848_14175 [Acidimicrobiia bacterium]|nr:hypothetical protein [Acidimicrobiia bacterium]
MTGSYCGEVENTLEAPAGECRCDQGPEAGEAMIGIVLDALVA